MSTTEVPQRHEIPRSGMRIESWIFLALAGFFAIAAAIYGSVTKFKEVAGFTALCLTMGLSLIVGTFLLFSARRLEHARPEDDQNADLADGAGDVGFFSPGSYWSFMMAFAAAVTAVATAFFLVWLMVIAIGALLVTVCGFIFEYHRRPASH